MFTARTTDHRAGAGPRRLMMLCRTALLAAFAIFTTTASATVVPLTVEEMTAIAEDIVTVRVEETKTSAFEGMIITTARCAVVDTLKGDMAGETAITYVGGSYGGLTLEAGGLAKLRKGEETILFLNRPYERLSKSQKAKVNVSSPLVQTPKIIGGWQGKLSLVSDPEAAAKRKGTDPVPVKAGVSRLSPRGVDPQPKNAPEYQQVAGAIRKLAQSQQTLKSRGATLKKIKGVNGEFAVPERVKDPVIRAFDPLPPMAYMSKKELEALKKQHQEEQAKKKTKAQVKGEE